MITQANSPYFFIVGAHKDATSSFYAYFREQPQIFELMYIYIIEVRKLLEKYGYRNRNHDLPHKIL